MAHDPKLKARALRDWATGKFSERELSEKYRVGKGTISRWIKESTGQNGADLSSAPKMNRYMEALEAFGVATMAMLKAQAELLADPGYLIKQETSDIIAHTRAITTGLERFIQLHRPVPIAAEHDALPERSEEGAALIPELVEEDCSTGL